MLRTYASLVVQHRIAILLLSLLLTATLGLQLRSLDIVPGLPETAAVLLLCAVLATVLAAVLVVGLSPRKAPALLLPLAATGLALVWSLGIMNIAGVHLDSLPAAAPLLILALGLLHAVHMQNRYHRQQQRRRTDRPADPDAANRQAVIATIARIGPATLAACIVAALGFLALALSDIAAIRSAGIVLGIGSASIVMVELTFTPALRAMLPATPQTDPAPNPATILPAATAPAATTAPATSADATRLMADSLRAGKPRRSVAVGRFVLINPAGQQRIRQTTSTTDLDADGRNNRRVTRFNSPADIAGTAVLTVENAGDDEFWVYLPALRKARRLAASNRRDAFVGTDFSYGDMLGHPIEDWTHRIIHEPAGAHDDTSTREAADDDTTTLVIESLPRDAAVAAATGYSRRLTWLRLPDHVPVRTEYYGPQDTLLKVYAASDIRLVDPARRCFQPMRQVMRNLVTGHTTMIEYSSFKTDVAVGEDHFQPRALERGA